MLLKQFTANYVDNIDHPALIQSFKANIVNSYY